MAMNEVECDVEYVDDVENEKSGRLGKGVRVTCTSCGDVAESFGQGGKSIRRCLALLRENCSEDEENFYVANGSEDD